MPVFEVRAISNNGVDADGWVRAHDFEDCNAKVLAKGFYITMVRPLDPWRPVVKPGRLNSNRLETIMLWVEAAIGRRPA
jgi:hypothetical protein